MTDKTTIVKCPNCGFEMTVGISELGVTIYCVECACKSKFFYDKELGTYNDNPMWQPPDDRDMAMMFRFQRVVRMGQHVSLNVPDLNLNLGAIVTFEGVQFTVVEVKDDGVELERVE